MTLGTTHVPKQMAPPAEETTGATTVAVGVAAVVSNGEDAARAIPSPPASMRAVLLAVGFIVVGTAIAGAIDAGRHANPFRVIDAITVFFLLVVFAAAVERLLEPLTQRLPGRQERADYEWARARLRRHDQGVTALEVARAKARFERTRADRVVIVWGLATAIATMACAAAGFFLLRALAHAPDWHGVARWVDALVTGLIVGSGTKPVHDLINRLQQRKDDG
jgi:hypothetical protein